MPPPPPLSVVELTPAERAARVQQYEADMAALEQSIRAETALAEFPAAGTPKQPFDKAHVSCLLALPRLPKQPAFRQRLA